jgi:sugar/nucleoside kinase (ribokinase family)
VTEIIVCGHICLDLLPDMATVPLSGLSMPGKLFEVGQMGFATGGSVSNTGLSLHKLGVDVRLMATVGADAIGQLTIDLLKERAPQLAEGIRQKPGTSGSYSVVLSPQQHDRIFLHCAGANAEFGADDVRPELFDGARIFHLGYPPILPRLMHNDGEELVEIFRRVKEHGLITSLDMSLPDPNGNSGKANWRRILERTLPYVDVFLPSLEEATFMLRREDYDRWGGKITDHGDATYYIGLTWDLLKLGSPIIGLKMGASGFYLATTTNDGSRLESIGLDPAVWMKQRVFQPAFEVDVVGTTGAGDSAYAGFLAAVLKGLSPRESARMFCAVGSHNVEAADSLSGVRSWDETIARLDAGWQEAHPRLMFSNRNLDEYLGQKDGN